MGFLFSPPERAAFLLLYYVSLENIAENMEKW
jgi:hypothetical protein